MNYSPEVIAATVQTLRDDAAGNKQATMTDIDSAAEMLTGLTAQRDNWASKWEKAVRYGAALETQRDELLSALQALLEANKQMDLTKLTPVSEEEKISRLHDQCVAIFNATELVKKVGA